VIRTILAGLPLTLLITATAMALGTLLAVPLTLGLRAGAPPVRWVCRVVVDLFRGVPQLVWLFIIYYGVSAGDARPTALGAGVAALGLVASGYLAEIFRGALKGVAAGQWEAAAALGFSPATTWARILTPQAARVALPAYTNYAIALLKDSAIVSTIGVAEMVFRTGQVARTSDMGVFVYVFTAVIYIALSAPLGMLSRRSDIKLREAVAR